MYPPTQPKVPPVRPRSSLSADEHYRFKGSRSRRKNSSTTIVTLIGFCVFLFVLCVFLLGALVYVGRTIADGVAASNITQTSTDKMNLIPMLSGSSAHTPQMVENDSRTNTKPIVIFRPNQNKQPIETTTTVDATTTITSSVTTIDQEMATKLPPEVVTKSKILNKLSFRLPREIRPKQYILRMHPDFETKTFTGNVTIRFEVLKSILYVALHSRSLNVTTDSFYRIGEGVESKYFAPAITFEHQDFEYWITEFADELEPGEYAINLSFSGSMANSIEGFYESLYLDQLSNETRSIATTKFEPTYARQAFPCFDEPSMKATFLITIVRPNKGGYHALSNMNVESEKVVGDNTEVSFAETVPMSTYLACFIVSDFAHKAMTVRGGLDSKDFEMRAFATEAQLHKVTYALKSGVGITEFYIEYFGIPYPLPKLDMTAIPDFSAGAMENWGLVTYRETALLYDKTISSTLNKRRVAMVVAHELAHMWFGNLVTMKWWNDLWLNEGFASYIEYKGINHIHPEWKMLDQFLTLDLHSAMRIDSTLASHPIVQTVENPHQISELFDSITYKKGASIIRMLEDVSGPEKFKMATHNYLKKYKFDNAETDDFLSEVESIGFDFDVKYMMKTWTEQMGLPVIEVSKVSNNQYKLTQKRFLLNPDDYNSTHTDSPFNYRWLIPITYFTSNDSTVQRSWFNDIDAEHTITLSSDVEWLKINKNQMGYYLVNYPEDLWKAITDALIKDFNLFSISDRANLISDAFNLADGSQLSYSLALDLTKYLRNENDYVPWSVAFSALKSVNILLHQTEFYKDFLEYNNKILDEKVTLIKWEIDDDDLKNLLSVVILNAACTFENEGTLEQVKIRFIKWLDQPDERPNPDVRQVIYHYGMKYAGNKDIWEKMWQLFVIETDASEKLKLMDGLSAIQDTDVLQKYINLAWNESYVRRQDYFTCLQEISRNPIGKNLIWNHIRDNWEKMIDRFGIGDHSLGRLVPGITSHFTSNEQLNDMLAFFRKYPESGAGETSRKQAIEKVKYNIKWLEMNKNQIGRWLKSQS